MQQHAIGTGADDHDVVIRAMRLAHECYDRAPALELRPRFCQATGECNGTPATLANRRYEIDGRDAVTISTDQRGEIFR